MKYIPFKTAVTLFEDRKIKNNIVNWNLHNTKHYDYRGTYPKKLASVLVWELDIRYVLDNYIVGVLNNIFNSNDLKGPGDPVDLSKNILNYVDKKYYCLKDGKVDTMVLKDVSNYKEKITLYGKKLNREYLKVPKKKWESPEELMELRKYWGDPAYLREFEPVYLNMYETGVDFKSYLKSDEFNDCIYEYWDYTTAYEEYRSYTVIGNKEKTLINYIEISVLEDDLKKLLGVRRDNIIYNVKDNYLDRIIYVFNTQEERLKQFIEWYESPEQKIIRNQKKRDDVKRDHVEKGCEICKTQGERECEVLQCQLTSASCEMEEEHWANYLVHKIFKSIGQTNKLEYSNANGIKNYVVNEYDSNLSNVVLNDKMSENEIQNILIEFCKKEVERQQELIWEFFDKFTQEQQVEKGF